MEECIAYGFAQNELVFRKNDDIKKSFLGFDFAVVKKS